MPRPKGLPKTGGRSRGTLNKATKDMRAWVNTLLQTNRKAATIALEQLWETDPAKALEIQGKLLEFVLPKLGRTELTGEDGAPVQTITQTTVILKKK